MSTRPIDRARVLLMGMMGSGKSSIGAALSERTGWPFVDNDELVVRATGRTARELLAEAGEPALRAAESAALAAGLALEPPVIVAVAAGTILDPEDRRRLDRGGFVVWLDARPEVLAERASGARHRPWLDADAATWFRHAMAERAALYREVADLRVDTERRGPGDAADAILAVLSAGG